MNRGTWYKYIFEKLHAHWFDRAKKELLWKRKRDGITVLPADNPTDLRLGWVVYEEVGAVIINSHAIARLEIDTPKYVYPHLRILRQ